MMKRFIYVVLMVMLFAGNANAGWWWGDADIEGDLDVGGNAVVTGTVAGSNLSDTNTGDNATNSLYSPNTTKLENWVCVTDPAFGATGDGVTDDTVAVQAAVDYCITNNILKLHVPYGVYKITDTISITKSLTFVGDGWTAKDTNVTPDLRGSVFLCDNATKPTYWFDFTGGSGGITDIELRTVQPDTYVGWVPNDTATWAIRSYRAPYTLGGNGDLIIANVMMRGFSNGIYVEGGSRIKVNNLLGQWWKCAIDIGGSYDVAMIDKVHHWSFYSADSEMVAYSEDNLKFMRSGRNDNAMYSNLFAWHANTGMEFYMAASPINPTGDTSRTTVTSIGFDQCTFGIVSSSDATIQLYISDGYILLDDTVASTGILSQGLYDYFQVSNIAIEQPGNNAIKAIGTNAVMVISNIALRLWDVLAGDEAALHSENGAKFITSNIAVISPPVSGAPIVNSGGIYYGDINNNRYGSNAAASAGAITLPVGHNYVSVTGAVQIDNCTARNSGDRVTLQFASNPIVRTNSISSGNIYLEHDNATWQTSANDILELISDGTSWWETSRIDY